MKIAIRMDDITPDMDWTAFMRVKAILDKAKVKPLLGIVPSNRDVLLAREPEREEFWAQMRSLQQEGYCIALHGMYHVYTTKKGGLFPLNHFSEFAGLPYAQQKQMIEEGKSILTKHGIHVDLFMAPGHSYDKNTLRALLDQGITKVTDGFGDTPYIYRGITFYPISFHMGKTLKKDKGYSTLVLHSNTMTEQDFALLETRLSMANKSQTEFISYGEYLQVKPQACSVQKRLGEWLLASVKWLLVRMR